MPPPQQWGQQEQAPQQQQWAPLLSLAHLFCHQQQQEQLLEWRLKRYSPF